jgi:hypothetical protein
MLSPGFDNLSVAVANCPCLINIGRSFIIAPVSRSINFINLVN